MINMEPHWKWREKYKSEEDKKSPFFGRTYNDAIATKQIYNYYIHPRWDDIGSSTLFAKIIFADYEEQYTVIELLGEWNDTLHNDIMYLKRFVAEVMLEEGINHFILICENVLNFHGSDDCYYEEWAEELEGGWICCLNTYDHVADEMKEMRLQYYMNFGANFNGIEWRIMKPELLLAQVKKILKNDTKRLM
jgi:hypothetical protein